MVRVLKQSRNLTECMTILQGHPRSVILAPIHSAYGTSYSTSIVSLVLSCCVSEILGLEHLCAKGHFSHPHPLFRPKFRGVPSRSVMLGSAESEHPKLTNREIIFEEFQPMWSQSTNVTDGRTDGQTYDLPYQATISA